ncbi:hypothetical protein WK99_17435 [Burkholderia ubonensis]|nr:hypothetical protein WK99_17435 [Burkholderia ubonensis]OJB05559.1 hypothetical protein BGV48_16725 [Burkholderia ubonensis]
MIFEIIDLIRYRLQFSFQLRQRSIAVESFDTRNLSPELFNVINQSALLRQKVIHILLTNSNRVQKIERALT